MKNPKRLAALLTVLLALAILFTAYEIVISIKTATPMKWGPITAIFVSLTAAFCGIAAKSKEEKTAESEKKEEKENIE